eukprot:scaffold7663_cov57-Phaeocystis_antarctica.AAC.5
MPGRLSSMKPRKEGSRVRVRARVGVGVVVQQVGARQNMATSSSVSLNMTATQIIAALARSSACDGRGWVG